MPDYENMSALEALRHAREVSGLTTDEIANAAGIRPCVMRRYFQQQDGYLPSFDKTPALCRAMGNRVLLQWQEAQIEKESCKPQAKNRLVVLVALAKIQAHLAEAQMLLEREPDRELAWEIRGLLWEVGQESRKAAAMLARLAEKRPPIACLKESRNRLIGFAAKIWKRGN